jgi:hypothetical protein
MRLLTELHPNPTREPRLDRAWSPDQLFVALEKGARSIPVGHPLNSDHEWGHQPNLVSGVLITVNIYALPPDVVVISWPRVVPTLIEGYDRASNIQDCVYKLPRRPLLETVWKLG